MPASGLAEQHELPLLLARIEPGYLAVRG